MNDYFEVKLDCVDACGKVERQEIKARFGQLSRAKIRVLMARFPHREWFAYLVGREDNGYFIEDLYIPEQHATATQVNKIDADKYNELSIVGAIHSHHHMNLKDFSQHDHEFVNSNHDLSVVATINENGQIHMQGQVRVKTPCGALMPVPVEISQYYEGFDEDGFLNEIESIFSKPKIIMHGRHHIVPKKKRKKRKKKKKGSQVYPIEWDPSDSESIYDAFITVL